MTTGLMVFNSVTKLWFLKNAHKHPNLQAIVIAMGILTPIHEPCHLEIQNGRLASFAPPLLPSFNGKKKASSEAEEKKKVSFNGNVRVQILEKDKSSGGGLV